ncbi:MAG: iron-sulfur cluster carrier protein ApbC [Xanthomonadaceae bacterium]|nr:iron-sulfur cluster carrier protein ApbC [Xanthomonadaceae bacterium]
MRTPDQAALEAALRSDQDPWLGCDLYTAKAVRELVVDGDRVRARIEVGFPLGAYAGELKERVRGVLAAVPDVGTVEVEVAWKVAAHAVQRQLQPMAGIRNVIAVASGKGGVGKSTTAVNLALALAGEGATVGLLDADIYGPSQPRMLGASGRPQSPDGKSVDPVVAHGLKTMSIGYLIDEAQPMVWRGPMVTQALTQLLGETNWGELDYLIVDMPPGTGDTQLTLSQKVPVAGAVIVTTPQDIALLDARKGLEMFRKVEVAVLGVIENMSTHICSKCGHEEHLFGSGGGERLATQYDAPFLGSLPLDIRIREQTDGGRPTVVAEPDSDIAAAYRAIARRMTAQLSLSAKDTKGKFPRIVME